MPRHKKHRCCRELDGEVVYKPAGTPLCDLQEVVILLDEFEAMRLCDLEGLTQEEAGLRMCISRGTVQRLLESGRQKIIGAIVQSATIKIDKKREEEE